MAAPFYVETLVTDASPDAPAERRPIAGRECWLDLAAIPAAPAPAPWPGRPAA